MSKNRHLSRTVCMQTLYEWEFRGFGDDLPEIIERNIQEFEKDVDAEYIRKVVNGVREQYEHINNLISEAAPEWPLDQVARVDKNTLRVAVFEMLHDPFQDVPPRVAINEAIEIGKTFGGENSSKFINGVLGYIYRKYEQELRERDARPAMKDSPPSPEPQPVPAAAPDAGEKDTPASVPESPASSGQSTD
jgi:N utilization substance protein B